MRMMTIGTVLSQKFAINDDFYNNWTKEHVKCFDCLFVQSTYSSKGIDEGNNENQCVNRYCGIYYNDSLARTKR